jgi:hypothetical protein
LGGGCSVPYLISSPCFEATVNNVDECRLSCSFVVINILRYLDLEASTQKSLHKSSKSCPPAIFLIDILAGGLQLDPLGTAATNRPIVPAPADYDDGEIGGMIGRGNRSTRRKPAPVPLSPPQTLHAARMRTRAAAEGSQ